MRFTRKALISGLVSAATILSLGGPVSAGFFDKKVADNRVSNYYRTYDTTNNINNTTHNNYNNITYNEIKMDSNEFEAEGKKWGKRLYGDGLNGANPALKPEDLVDGQDSREFICQLIGGIKFFEVNTDLKQAFRKGFREGYPDRIADLVLGPHLQRAAAIIGYTTADDFKKVVLAFEDGWAKTLRKSVDTFVVLIAEGSQADRKEFIEKFTMLYKEKYDANQKIIKGGTADMQLTTAGGTRLVLDTKNTVSTLDIPSELDLKNEIYKQTFLVMGDEMGRKYSSNLIARPELVDWLRRSKTALNMDTANDIDPKLVAQNLRVIRKAFCADGSYGVDAESVFDGLAAEAGYNATSKSNAKR